MLVTNRDELAQALDKGAIAAILATGGVHPLEGDLANLERLRAAGYRVLGLQHFFDNELGGSLHGVSGAGLTDFGRSAVARALVSGMIIDVAHSSEAAVRDVLQISSRPLLVVTVRVDMLRSVGESLQVNQTVPRYARRRRGASRRNSPRGRRCPSPPSPMKSLPRNGAPPNRVAPGCRRRRRFAGTP